MPRIPSRLRCHLLLIALLAVAAASAFGCLWVTDRAIWQHQPIGFLGVYPARSWLLAITAVAVVAALAMLAQRRGTSRLGTRLQLAVGTTTLALLALEVVFMFVPRSHNVGYTLATRIWYEKYWGHENSLGYRDAEPARLDGKKLVFALGDSFTAGAGIPHVAARFSNVLARLRPDLQVMNLGRSGSDTGDEFRRLEVHPLHPDAVVLQYYPNDVDAAARRAGHELPPFTPYEDLPFVKLRFLVRSSFLANFVYWQLPHGDAAAYHHFLQSAHEDPEVARQHHADLERILAWTRAHHVQLVVALFPLLEELAWSRDANRDVKTFFSERGVPVLDVADLVEDLPVAERRVNSHDGHASAIVHERVGVALAKLVAI